ncbi:MAG: gamma-glutamyl kinase [Cypionkella sp.]
MTYREFMATLEPEIRPNCKRPIEVFAVMREPLDWLGSWYRFRQRDSILNIRNSTRGISFEDFVRTYCSPEPPTWADLPPQIDFIEDEASGIGPDHLFRYEDHESFVKALGARLGIEIRLPRLNVAPEGNLELSAPTLARLRDHCARDFALYQQLSARRGPIQT